MEPLPPNIESSSNIGNNNLEMPPISPEILPSMEKSNNQEKAPIVGEVEPSKNIQSAPVAQASSATILPPLVQGSDSKTSTMVAGGVTPSVASDVKLEPGWIDAAKKIINSTENEPYQREEAFKGLKSDYQKKRLESSTPQ